MELGSEVSIPRRSSKVPQFIATVLVDSLALSFGLTMGWSSSALPLLQSADTPLPCGPISSSDASWLVSLLCLIAMVTTPLYRYICERFGRKMCGYLTVLPGLISVVLLLLASCTTILYISRAIMGLTLAGTFIFCPVYVSETVEDEVRGALGVMLMLLRNIGICGSYILGAYCSFYTVAWLSLAPLIILLLALFWLPETPVYLLRHGKDEQATQALQRLRGKQCDVSQELYNIKISLRDTNSEAATPASYKEFFSSPVARRALVIMLVLNSNQQLCGFYGILTHTVLIFESVGSTWSPHTCSIIVGIMLVCGTFVSVILCDRVGRKVLLITSDSIMTVCLMLISTYFYFETKGVQQFGVLPVACLSVYVIALNVGLASLPVLIETEIFSPRFRSTAISITAPFTWSLTFAVSKYFTTFTNWLGNYGVYWFFAAVCIIGMMLIILVLPETKGRALEVILNDLETRGLCSQGCVSRRKLYTVLCNNTIDSQTLLNSPIKGPM
ncbi:facilitated trehalose transporter Tret1 isoform X1 [Anabrus simplex]|uniref:facilitated trehalose transporter Tret1 isoform X1 n=1 Tax=Anabrus simplex TaxID=316456 RepID=UPI0035A31900